MRVERSMMVCVDCYCVIANGESDFESLSQEDATMKGVAALGPNVVVGDEMDEFSRQSCECCGLHLAGWRHEVVVLRSE